VNIYCYSVRSAPAECCFERSQGAVIEDDSEVGEGQRGFPQGEVGNEGCRVDTEEEHSHQV